jgi:hypothetical protein
MTKEAISKAPSGRPARQPVGLRHRQKTVNSDPNYVERWVVDYDGTGDRIAAFKDGGYEHVMSKTNRLGDSRVDNATPEGSIEQRSVGNGQKGYLMRIPRELYEADQKAKQVIVNKTEEALKRPALDGAYGTLDISNKTE